MYDVEVEQWRLEQFGRMGFTVSSSLLLNEWQVDLHEARKLVAAGCPPHFAMQILRPLEDRAALHADGVAERIEEYSIKV